MARLHRAQFERGGLSACCLTPRGPWMADGAAVWLGADRPAQWKRVHYVPSLAGLLCSWSQRNIIRTLAVANAILLSAAP